MIEQTEILHRHSHITESAFHSHSRFEIYYFHEGSCNYLIGDKIYVLKPGDLIIMNGMTLHRPHITGDTYVRTVVHFYPAFAQTLFSFSQKLNILQPFIDLRNHRVHLDGAQRIALERLFARLDRAKNGSDAADHYEYYIVFMELLLMVYRLFEREMRQRTVFHTVKEEHAQRIIDYIGEHFSEEIHMHHLEEALHLNRFYLAKIFKEVTGSTIFQYINERRINEAKLLILLEPELSLTDISYQVGFKHGSHFSRLFKKIVGMTPEQYRRQTS